MANISTKILLAPAVEEALHEGKAVVALESTVISHGLPYPENIRAAQSMEKAIREEGAVPATIGLIDGKIKVGLNAEELELFATTPGIYKVSRRDLAYALATRRLGATTVAGTMLCASMTGIRFFATGGIGGVHRGAAETMDISADLTELSRTPVMVVCAGAKSILDLDLTMEYLETQGVPVLGWQTNELPAFYVRESGFHLPLRVDDVETMARIASEQWECGLKGIVVGCPIPTEHAMDPKPLEAAIDEALRLAQQQGIKGAATTPFILGHVAQSTGGTSVEANIALLINNARWAARFAHAYHISQQ